MALFVLRQVEEKLDDARAVAMEVRLEINDGAIPLFPDGLRCDRAVGQALAAENLRMHANDEHLLVVGTVKDTNASAFGQVAGGAPKEIVVQVRRARVLGS